MLASREVLNPCWGSRDRIADILATDGICGRIEGCLDRDRALAFVRSNLKVGCLWVCVYSWGI
jgi:hypothetical protein